MRLFIIVFLFFLQGPDWNPRSLSSFSTFGGSSHPSELEVNGSVEPQLNGHSGMHEGNLNGVHKAVVPPPLMNGVNNTASPIYEKLSRPDLIPTPTPVVPPLRHRHKHSKSLVVEEDPGRPVPAPRHSHSRSLVDEESLQRSPMHSPGVSFKFSEIIFNFQPLFQSD